MTTKTGYASLPSDPATPQNYVLLPVYPHRIRRRPPILRRYILPVFSILLLSISLYLIWPSDPTVQIVRVELNNVQIHSSPSLSLDLSLSLTARVRNRDFFSLDYDSLTVALGYRGRELGFVNSSGGKLKARGSSYVDAVLTVDGFEILHDIWYFIEDVARGSLPFDTVSRVEGRLGFLSLVKIPIKAKVSCEVYVNPNNQTVMRQNCYAE